MDAWFFQWSAAFNLITSLFLGVFIFVRQPNKLINRVFLFFALSVASWSCGYFFWQGSTSSEMALLWCRVFTAVSFFIPSSFFCFAMVMIKRENRYKKTIFFFFLLSFVFLILSATTLLVPSVSPKLCFKFWPNAGKYYWVFIAYYFVVVLYAHLLMFQEFRTKRGYERDQIRYVAVGTLIGFLGGATNFPLWYDVAILPVGNFLVSIYVLMIAIAIVRYRLMDIRVVAVSTVIFIIVYTVTLGIPVYFYRTGEYLVALILMGALATAGPSMFLYLQRRANDALMREQRKYQQTLMHASSGMSRIKDLKKLLRLVVRIVTRVLNTEHCAVYVHDKDAGVFALGALQCKKTPVELSPSIALDSTIIQYISREGGPILFDEVQNRSNSDAQTNSLALLMEMTLLKADMIVPSVIDRRLVAFMVLGRKLSGAAYTADDVNVFTILSNQCAMSIENAQFFDRVKESQEQLFQAEKLATIGTMADGLAHQINNRLHALGFIAGDLQDSIALFQQDPAKLSWEQLSKDLDRGFKRILENVLQGGEVVRGLLNYSRQGKTEKEQIVIATLIDESLQMVALKVKLSDLKIIIDIPPEAAELYGNFVHLQEVLFNIVDNAYFSMMEKKKKESDFVPTLTFSSQRNGDKILFRICDNGMGIRDEDQRKLFTPFFTTKASSRKGNGLGLFIMQKIIQDDHGGEIAFESEYTKGVGINIVLPVSKPE